MAKRTSETGFDPRLCPYCRESLRLDINIRCPFCRTPHHLGCFAEGRGCGVFGCLEPEDPSRAPSGRTADQLVEEVFRAELRSATHTNLVASEVPIAVMLLTLFTVIVIVLLGTT